MRYAWFVLLAIGCYAAPDYGDTHFKCDADHPCPAGQSCVNGVCGGGGSGSNSIDAAIPAMTVACGTAACGAGQKCCADILNGPTCIAVGATCTGIAATCDGIEDCNGMPCCETGSTAIGCAATCGGTTICRDAADCTDASKPSCCMILGTMEPWGRCYSVCP